MKATDSKTGAIQAKKTAPFFSKEKGRHFFETPVAENSFFPKPASIQAKLTIGKPNDPYEKEADSMADKVIQRMNGTGSPDTQFNPVAPLHSITPFIQNKCAECEQEEREQKKEEGLQDEKVQRKPIFESEADNIVQGKSDGSALNAPAVVQAKCTECEEEERMKKKDDEGDGGELLQKKPIFESNAEPPDDETNVQRKCAACEKEDKLQKSDDSTSSAPLSGNIEGRLNASRGSGQAMPEETRRQMESSFGADFSGVRIHNDSNAVQMSRDLRAQAFTHGNDIYFGSGKYDTKNNSGRHLLAHELTHTIQQGGTAIKAKSVQSRSDVPAIQRQSVKVEDIRVRVNRGWYEPPYSPRYEVYDDIQWHANVMMGVFDLIVFIDDDLRSTLTPEMIAATTVLVLQSGIEVPFAKGDGLELMKFIYRSVVDYDLKGSKFNIPVQSPLIREQFEQDPYNVFFENLKAHDFNSGDNYLIASGNFGTGKGKGKGKGPEKKGKTDQPAWINELKTQFDELLKKARQNKSGAELIPDDVVFWKNEKTGDWYINVWVNFDTQGKNRKAYPVRLIPGEKAEQLLDRAEKAASQVLNKDEDEERRKQAASAPDWARKLEADVKHILGEQRSKDKDATDFPDGVALTMEDKKLAASGAPAVYLQIWVERGEKQVQRNYGSVPLTEKANPNDVVPYIRRMSALLRQYENIPGKKQPPEDIQINFTDTSGMALAAFPSDLMPTDMREDDITVTGANNEFLMELNYEAVYGGGPLKDLYIASKLYQQYIHFYFEIYKVPTDLVPPKGVDMDRWLSKWNWLYLTYNPDKKTEPEKEDKPKPGSKEPAKELPAKPAPTVPAPGPRVYETDGSDARSRVRFPDEAGDYLVKAYTGHGSIGEHSLKRMSSVAWYPVRTVPLEKEGISRVTKRTGKIESAESEIKAFEQALATGKLDDKQKKLIEGSLQFKKEELQRLQAAETHTLSESTATEISFTETTLKQLKELEGILPAIKEKAKNEKIPPSDLIEKRELLTIYWFILTNNRTIPGYQKELEEKLKQLRGVLSRAEEFKNEFDPASPYQYNIEAAFVSTVTGKVYPLTMMIGEAPQRKQNQGIYNYGSTGMPQTFYNLVDVTTKDTAKVYKGYSYKSGPEGHKEAIDNVFKDFGKEAVYGEGKIAVRFPPGKVGAKDPNHPGTEPKFYNSKEGILKKVLKILAIVALVAGVAAIAATGVGAPAAALLLGAIAGVAGAITSIHNISERSARHKLEWDAEMALDIISIISIIPLTAGIRIATVPRTLGNLQKYRVATKLLEFYGWTEMGATVYLVPKKMAEDIKRIELDNDLTDAQKKKMIEQAQLGAFQTGIMMLGSIAASHAGAKSQAEGFVRDEDIAAFRDQIDLLELEGAGEYQSMADKGWVDPNGKWTDLAPDIVKQKPPVTEPPVTEKHPPVEPKKPVTEPKQEPEGKVKKPAEPEVKPEVPEKAPEDTPVETGKPEPEQKPDVPDEKQKPLPETKPEAPEQKKAPDEEVKPEAPEQKPTEGPEEGKKTPETETKPPTAPDEKPAETIQDKNIREAEETAKKAEETTEQYKKEAEQAREEAKKAKENLKGKKGDERKAAKKELAEAESKAKYAEEVYNMARDEEANAKYKASGLRQEKLDAEVQKALAVEEPIKETIRQKQKQQEDITKSIKAKLEKKTELIDSIDKPRPGMSEEKAKQEAQDALRDIKKIGEDIKELNRRYQDLNDEIRAQRNKLADVQIETLKRIEALEAEKRASKGITPELYDRLRSGSPSSKIRKKFNTAKVDAVYGTPIEGTPHADHIVSMNEITQMEGFSRLTEKQQLEVLNLVENFMALDGKVNSSKGDRSFSEWKGYPPLGEIPPQRRKALLDIETKARDAIRKAIEIRDPVKKKQ